MRSPSSPHRSIAALAAVGALILVGCGDGDDDTTTAAPDTTDAPTAAEPDDTDQPADDEQDGEDEPSEDSDEQAAPASDLPDGVAATVDGAEIDRSTLADLFDELVEAPIFAAQAEEDPERFESTLQAQILSQLVVSEIVLRGAEEDFDIEVSQDDLDATLDDMVEEAGGPDAFDSQLEEAGLTRDVFVRMELPLTALLEQLESEFGDLEADPAAEPGAMPEGQAALQEWGVEKFAAADVAVDPGLGTWNPEAGQILPPS